MPSCWRIAGTISGWRRRNWPARPDQRSGAARCYRSRRAMRWRPKTSSPVNCIPF